MAQSAELFVGRRQARQKQMQEGMRLNSPKHAPLMPASKCPEHFSEVVRTAEFPNEAVKFISCVLDLRQCEMGTDAKSARGPHR